jgi:hypothetical protein
MESGQDAGVLAGAAQPVTDDGPAADGIYPGGSERPGGRGGALAWTAAMAALLALLVLAAAVGVFFLARVRAFDAAGSRRQAAVAAARHAVADLTTADYRHPQQYFSRLQADGTGKFLRLFVNSATGFRDILTRGKVQTAGRVAAVGVQRISAGTARLSVLAYVTVKNSQTPGGTRRVYRLTVSLIPDGSRWLVSDVEFVK